MKKVLPKILKHMVLLILLFFALYPVFMVVSNSLKTQAELYKNTLGLPQTPQFQNYAEAIRSGKLGNAFFVTLLLTVISVVLITILGSFAAFALSRRRRTRSGKLLYQLMILGMMIPYQVTQVPLYILVVNKFHMSNTYVALILPGIVTSYNVFLAKQFFASIPTPLIESAKLDGCSHPGIFVRIVLPLSKTVLAVMAINTFMSSWNTFFWPFLVTSKDRMYTIQVGLKTFKFANETLFAPMMAGATLSALPMFILFFALQKYFLEGVTIGAVKG